MDSGSASSLASAASERTGLDVMLRWSAAELAAFLANGKHKVSAEARQKLLDDERDGAFMVAVLNSNLFGALGLSEIDMLCVQAAITKFAQSPQGPRPSFTQTMAEPSRHSFAGAHRADYARSTPARVAASPLSAGLAPSSQPPAVAAAPAPSPAPAPPAGAAHPPPAPAPLAEAPHPAHAEAPASGPPDLAATRVVHGSTGRAAALAADSGASIVAEESQWEAPAAAAPGTEAQGCMHVSMLCVRCGEWDVATEVCVSELDTQRDNHFLVDACAPALSRKLNAGDVINGRFRIEAVLSTGGMGIVYKAVVIQLGSPVIVKTIRPTMLVRNDRAALRLALCRFYREAMMSTKLKSARNIMRTVDWGQDDNGIVFLAADFVHGDSLDRVLRSCGSLSVRASVWVARELMVALGHMHDGGYVHRDIKPSNIMITGEAGSPRATLTLIDFGLARNVENSNLTVTNNEPGTFLYMAPEQLDTEFGAVGVAADVWAVGAVLFECLIGSAPFAAATSKSVLFNSIMHSPLPEHLLAQARPGGANEGISDVLKSIIRRAMAKRQDRRFQAVYEFHEALLEAEASEAREALEREQRIRNQAREGVAQKKREAEEKTRAAELARLREAATRAKAEAKAERARAEQAQRDAESAKAQADARQPVPNGGAGGPDQRTAFQQRIAPVSDLDAVVHFYISCHGCRRTHIVGPRFQCKTCLENFCSRCVNAGVHDSAHRSKLSLGKHSQPSGQPPLDVASQRHTGICCNLCHAPEIIGMRFLCGLCPASFNLCERCFETRRREHVHAGPFREQWGCIRNSTTRHCAHCAGKPIPCGCEHGCRKGERVSCTVRPRTVRLRHCVHCSGSDMCSCSSGCRRGPGANCVAPAMVLARMLQLRAMFGQ